MAEKGISGVGNDWNLGEFGGNFELVEVLEQLYSECPKPGHTQRLEMMSGYPVLSTFESKQIKLWFQNRRCHEKQKKKDIELLSVNEKLAAAQKLLLVENERLHKELSQLINENEYIQQLLQNVSEATASNPSQHSLEPTDNSAGVLLLAEEKITVTKGKAVDWFPIPRMKCTTHLPVKASDKLMLLVSKEPAVPQSLSPRLREDLNGLNSGGRSLMSYDAAECLIISPSSITDLGTKLSNTTSLFLAGEIIRAEFSILLQDTLTTEGKKDVLYNIYVLHLMAEATPGSSEAVALADWICQSFRSNFGGALLKSYC